MPVVLIRIYDEFPTIQQSTLYGLLNCMLVTLTAGATY